MATRRIVATEKTILDQDDPVDATPTASAVPRAVVMKLLGFTFAMVVIPIGAYFATVHTIFKGNSSWAGGLAALLANVVLIGYVVVALNEEDPAEKGKGKGKGKETKKDL